MKKAIFFFDANNWYHNTKKYHNPSEIDIQKFVNHLCKIKDYEVVEIRWYASVPSISDGSNMYYKHISYLDSLKKKGVKVITRKLQKLSNKEICIVETKGREDLDDIEKIQRLMRWCEDINAIQNKVHYRCLYIKQEAFQKYTPRSFNDLINSYN